MSWRILNEGRPLPAAGYDGEIRAWDLANELSDRRTVLFKVSGTVLAMEGLPLRLEEAVETGGQSEIERVLRYEEPPSEITVLSHAPGPVLTGGKAGPELEALLKIIDYFDQRGIFLMEGSTGYATGNPPALVSTTYYAHLIDVANDDLIVSLTDHRSQLDAARAAQQWWQQHKEPPAEPQPSAMQQRLDLLKGQGLTLIWNLPDESDPESMYMAHVVDVMGAIRGFAVGQDKEEVLLTVADDLLPDEPPRG